MRKLTENEILEKILICYCALSPENLSCDGELSRSATMQRYIDVDKELKLYFKMLGREVSENEIWQWSMNRDDKN